MIYLDYCATTKTNEEVLDTFIKVSNDYYGNPNSLHDLGVKSSNLLDASRAQVAKIFSVLKDEIYFTSGASESNNTVLKGVALKYSNRGKHIITTKVEHASVYETCKYLEKRFGFCVTYLDVDEFGVINPLELKEAMTNDTILVSIMHVNSEVGSIQPIKKCSEIIKEYKKCYFHVDATQSVGKMNVNLKEMGVDFASFSAHKYYGIKGTGILYKRKGIEIDQLIHGGNQEDGYRAGTQDVPSIVASSKALRLINENLDEKYEYVKNLNTRIRMMFRDVENVRINSGKNTSVPHILNISVIGLKPEVLLHALEQDGIYISTKSACSSKSTNHSRVLEAMHLDEEVVKSGIRISFSHLTRENEIDYAVQKIISNAINLRK